VNAQYWDVTLRKLASVEQTKVCSAITPSRNFIFVCSAIKQAIVVKQLLTCGADASVRSKCRAAPLTPSCVLKAHPNTVSSAARSRSVRCGEGGKGGDDVVMG
jgi:hypothetical protein